MFLPRYQFIYYYCKPIADLETFLKLESTDSLKGGRSSHVSVNPSMNNENFPMHKKAPPFNPPLLALSQTHNV